MLILSFSGQGEKSLTLKSLEILEHHKDVETFDKIIIKPTFDFTKIDEVIKKMQAADVIIWAVSPFHMNIPSHMIHFFEECRKRKVYMNNVNTFFTTNMRVCDNFLSSALEHQIKTISSIFVHGLSFATSDIVNRKMGLYNIATPDKPPKQKSLSDFNKHASFRDGEGLRTAVQWYNVIKGIANTTKLPSSFNVADKKTVLFVDMDESADMHSPYVNNTVDELKNFYRNLQFVVEDIAQRNYKINPCDGCMICYANKVCKFKDDYLDYEKQLQKADIIIYYGTCIGGFTSSISKACIDRGVKNGLMPAKGVLPSEMEKYQAIGFVLDTDSENYEVFKDYCFALTSFGCTHYLGILANIPYQSANDLETMKYYSMLVIKDKMFPQRNFYSEKIGKHFSDLTQHIPDVIPKEAEYYRKAGGYEPIPLDPNSQAIGPETFQIRLQMRQIPYTKTIEALDNMNRSSNR